jgi:hypothetical protein
MKQLTLFACALLLLGVNGSPQWDVGQVVNTTSGPVSIASNYITASILASLTWPQKVKGHAAALFKEVSEYLGIPWAAPPIGNLRFMPAQPYQGSYRTIVAEKYGPDCPTISAKRSTNSTGGNSAASGVLSLLDQAGHVQSEDCLTLNIWTKPQVGEKKKGM